MDDDDWNVGDGEDFSGPQTAGRSMESSDFPPVEGGMLQLDDGGLLFDDLGETPAEAQFSIANLAARAATELPPSRAVGEEASASLKGVLAPILAMRAEARFKKNVNSASSSEMLPAALSAAPPRQLPGSRWTQKRRRTVPWTEDETSKFFVALRQFGTNLALIEKQFPGRERNDILRKFHAEQKLQPRRLYTALDPSNELPIDVASFEIQCHEWARQKMLRDAAPLGAEALEAMKELEMHGVDQKQPPTEAVAAAAPSAPNNAAAVVVPVASGATPSAKAIDRSRSPLPSQCHLSDVDDDTPLLQIAQQWAAHGSNKKVRSERDDRHRASARTTIDRHSAQREKQDKLPDDSDALQPFDSAAHLSKDQFSDDEFVF